MAGLLDLLDNVVQNFGDKTVKVATKAGEGAIGGSAIGAATSLGIGGTAAAALASLVTGVTAAPVLGAFAVMALPALLISAPSKPLKMLGMVGMLALGVIAAPIVGPLAAVFAGVGALIFGATAGSATIMGAKAGGLINGVRSLFSKKKDAPAAEAQQEPVKAQEVEKDKGNPMQVNDAKDKALEQPGIKGDTPLEQVAREIQMLKNYANQNRIINGGHQKAVLEALDKATAEYTRMGGEPSKIKSLDGKEFEYLAIQEIKALKDKYNIGAAIDSNLTDFGKAELAKYEAALQAAKDIANQKSEPEKQQAGTDVGAQSKRLPMGAARDSVLLRLLKHFGDMKSSDPEKSANGAAGVSDCVQKLTGESLRSDSPIFSTLVKAFVAEAEALAKARAEAKAAKKTTDAVETHSNSKSEAAALDAGAKVAIKASADEIDKYGKLAALYALAAEMCQEYAVKCEGGDIEALKETNSKNARDALEKLQNCTAHEEFMALRRAGVKTARQGNEFVAAKENALRALYNELGGDKPNAEAMKPGNKHTYIALKTLVANIDRASLAESKAAAVGKDTEVKASGKNEKVIAFKVATETTQDIARMN